jgi:hypothetical protein
MDMSSAPRPRDRGAAPPARPRPGSRPARSCVARRTNNLDETDRSPLHPCPVCLRKLHDSIGFDVNARERALYQFYRKHGLAAEAGVADRRLARLR